MEGTSVEFFIRSGYLVLKKCDFSIAGESPSNRKAVVAGYFNPFTNAHLSLIKNTSELFGEVIVLVVLGNESGINSAQEISKSIANILKRNNLTNCTVDISSVPVAEYCKDAGISYLVRDVKNNFDFNYENELRQINSIINQNLKTIFIPVEDDLVSSKTIQAIQKMGLSIDAFIP